MTPKILWSAIPISLLGLLLAACGAAPTPEKVVETVIVEKEVVVTATPESTPKVISEPTPTSSNTDSQPQIVASAKYLPLAEGNTWHYRRTVENGQQVLSWEAYREGDTITNARGMAPDIVAGTTEEEYVVEGQIQIEGLQFWEIKVNNPLARDGRYGGFYHVPNRIFWGVWLASEHYVAVSEILIIESQLAGFSNFEKTLLIEPLLEGLEATITNGSSIEYIARAKRVDITVPAGEFRGCIEMITLVKPENEGQTDGDPWANGWTLYSYYAPGIGLVKEIQKNYKDETVYTLDLVAYQIR